MLLGNAPDTAICGHTTPEVGRSAPTVVGSSWAELLCLAISSQYLPCPHHCLISVLNCWYLCVSRPLGSAPQSSKREKTQLGSHRSFFVPSLPMHRQTEEAEETQMTQLPSIKLLLKEQSCGMAMSQMSVLSPLCP